MLLRPGKQPSPALFNLCFCSVIWVPSDLSRTLKIPVVTAFRVIPVCLPASIHPSVHPFLPSLCQEAMLRKTSLTKSCHFVHTHAHARAHGVKAVMHKGTHTSCNSKTSLKLWVFRAQYKVQLPKRAFGHEWNGWLKAFYGLLLVLKEGIQPVFRGLRAVFSQGYLVMSPSDQGGPRYIQKSLLLKRGKVENTWGTKEKEARGTHGEIHQHRGLRKQSGGQPR